MKIIHFITSLRKSAGTTTFVNGLSDGLCAKDCEVTIALKKTDGEYIGERPYNKSIKIIRIFDVLKSDAVFDIVHIHGLWEMPIIKAAQWALKKGIFIVWSPHGALAPWAFYHHWWKKVFVWHILQKPLLKKVAIFHSTAARESDWIRGFDFSQKIVEVPLGTNELYGDCAVHRGYEKTVHNLLFVGRIYPVKGLVNLIKAWKLVVGGQCLALSERWKLRIVGPDQAGHRAELEKLVGERGLNDVVEFTGSKFGAELSNEYETCDCLVLPSFTENFGATVVDAMAHGKPVITSEFTPWKEVQDYGCGWWVSNKPEHLAKAIQEMIDIGDDKRREMGFRGRKLVEEKYTWDAVAEAMIKGYEDILGSRTFVANGFANSELLH